MNYVALRFCYTVAMVSVLCCVPSSMAHAQKDQAPVDFSYSYASFAGNGNTSVVEFSYSFSENGLTYVNDLGQLIIELQLSDTAGRLRESYVWTISHPLPKGELPGRMIRGIKRFELPPGTYPTSLRLIDGGNVKRSDSTHFTMNVRAFPEERFAISDIELIAEMAPARGDSRDDSVQRNGYVLVRNVDAIVTTPDFRLNTYVEIYNSHRLPGSQFTLSYLIADSSGRGLYRRDTLLPRSAGEMMFDVNSVIVNGLSTGWYIVAARVFNGPRSAANDSMEALRSFFVYNPGQDSLFASTREFISGNSDSAGLIDPIYAGLRDEELNMEFRKASLIMSKHQQNIWRQLKGLEAKGRFLTRFWMALDDDPSTPENPFRDDYYERVNYARKLYKSVMYPNGWDSDRGRVLLQYGKPDQIDRHPSDYNRRPYEVWHYTSLRYDFVFVDRSQTDNYQLVHSTAPNEVNFPDWEGEDAALHKQMYPGEFDNDSSRQ